MVVHLKYKLKYLESLMNEDEYGEHHRIGITPFHLYEMMKEGKEKEAFKLVNPKIKKYLQYLKKVEAEEELQ